MKTSKIIFLYYTRKRVFIQGSFGFLPGLIF